MRITGVESTDLFTGTVTRPLQIIRVTIEGPSGGTEDAARGAGIGVRIAGAGAESHEAFGIEGIGPGESRTIEIGVTTSGPAGVSRPVTVIAETAGSRIEHAADITVAEPGWTMWMVSHFHYDPVWWSTQGQFTEARLVLPDEDGALPDTRTAFELVRLHLEKARRDPDYKFVLAEIDYLKPYFDTFPHERAEFRALIKDGRVELVGGTYNEPNTNLTGPELTIRNAVYGMGHQRDLLGADPRTAWMLDSFGHDPGFPGLMAAAGLTSSSWARGPFHQWGPDDNTRMQFPAEFEWLSPDGSGLLTAYMANHYGAGWGGLHQSADLTAAETAAYEQFRQLAPVAATRNVMLPVGSDHVLPARWVTDVHRSWNSRYVWPKFVTAIPREFFDAVRAEASGSSSGASAGSAGGAGVAVPWLTPQTRDMNPVYTGKDVSYIDTKQANRAAETVVSEAERFATLAWLRGAAYPAESLDKAWRQLAYGAHHDAITGTESDQVYLDLLAGWQEAWQLGSDARRDAIAFLSGSGSGSGGGAGGVTVFNGLARERDGMATVTVRLDEPGTAWLTLARDGTEVPALAEHVKRHPDGSLAEVTLTFRARGVPALGFRRYELLVSGGPSGGAPGDASGGWTDAGGTAIENDAASVTADAALGGALTSVIDKRTGREMLRGPGNELVLQDEYEQHPRWGEGPWHLSPKGPGPGSAAAPATVRAQRSPAGSRLVAVFTLGGLSVTQETIVWDGADRVEFRTHVSGSIGQDKLLRVRFPADVPGGLPVYQTATAVIGRPFGLPEADTAEHWWTLDNPAYQWFGVGSVAALTLSGAPSSGAASSGAASSGAPSSGAGVGAPVRHAIGVAEVITPFSPNAPRRFVRDLLVSLAGAGVTATCSRPDGPRYGTVEVDSNLPDFRIAVGGPDENEFTAEVLAACDPAVAKRLATLVADAGSARVWVPASRSRSAASGPAVSGQYGDVRGPRDLPVLIVAGTDAASLEAALSQLCAGIADGTVSAELVSGEPVSGEPVSSEPVSGETGDAGTALADGTVAVINRGTPSAVVTPDGTLWMALMRACSAWPSGVWIDGDQRRAPDGSSFAWQHWSHTFSYALAVSGDGDWRDAGFNGRAEDYNHDLVAVASPPSPAAPVLPASDIAGTPLVSVDAPNVSLIALKPRGNPLAAGRADTTSAAGTDGASLDGASLDGASLEGASLEGASLEGAREVTVRVRETDGRATRARVRIGSGLEAAWRTDLLEDTALSPLEVRDDTALVDLKPFETVTLAARVTAAESGGPVGNQVPARPDAERARPSYSRYWLHGEGAAPAGNMPVTAVFTPPRATFDGSSPQRVRLTVACGPEPASGQVRLVLPSGVTAEVDGAPASDSTTLRYDLQPHGFTTWDVSLQPAPGAAEGRYFVTARATVFSSDNVLPGNTVSGGTVSGNTVSAGRIVEDAALVTIGEDGPPERDLPPEELFFRTMAETQALAAEADVEVPGGGLVVAPGERARLRVRVVSRLASELRGELRLISPFGTWEGTSAPGDTGSPAGGDPWVQAVTVPPGGETECFFDVTVPLGVTPGWESWLLAKLMYFGRVRYSPSVRLAAS